MREARERVAIAGQAQRQFLDRHAPSQLRVARRVHLAHPTRSDGAEDHVATEGLLDGFFDHEGGHVYMDWRTSPDSTLARAGRACFWPGV
ncbi:MAG TPA: hypothetical protein VNA69_20940 [Thermoanaerobaculia bacterium]|nr:hypothetical protein [Thermoanaerobaculia bacterium]